VLNVLNANQHGSAHINDLLARLRRVSSDIQKGSPFFPAKSETIEPFSLERDK